MFPLSFRDLQVLWVRWKWPYHHIVNSWPRSNEAMPCLQVQVFRRTLYARNGSATMARSTLLICLNDVLLKSISCGPRMCQVIVQSTRSTLSGCVEQRQRHWALQTSTAKFPRRQLWTNTSKKLPSLYQGVPEGLLITKTKRNDELHTATSAQIQYKAFQNCVTPFRSEHWSVKFIWGANTYIGYFNVDSIVRIMWPHDFCANK